MFGAEIINAKNQIFNTVVYAKKNKYLYKSKKKFVPIREYTPLFLRSLGVKNYYTKNINKKKEEILKRTSLQPILCYESIFSFFVAKESHNASAIILMASEEFMGKNYFGKKQYLNIVKLRAIENNRFLLKCSSINGISCLIDNKGNVIKYLKPGLEFTNIPVINQKSIYQKIVKCL